MPPKGRGRGQRGGGSGGQDYPRSGQTQSSADIGQGQQYQDYPREDQDQRQAGRGQRGGGSGGQDYPRSGQTRSSADIGEGQQYQDYPREDQDQRQAEETVPETAALGPKKEIKIEPEDLGLERRLVLKTDFPTKPRPNKTPPGRIIRLISNCYNLELPRGCVYHYDVEIVSKRKPKTPKTGEIAPLQDEKKYRCMNTKRNREIIEKMLRENPIFRGIFAAYDGRKNLYTRQSLDIPNPPLQCDVSMPADNTSDHSITDDFTVIIQPVRKNDSTSCAISLDSLQALFNGSVSSVNQDVIMAIETILRHRPCLRFYPIGRNFFSPPDPRQTHPLGGGKEIWFGFHQSLRLGKWKPMVNIDITATTFYQKRPVLNYIADIIRENVSNLNQITLTDADIVRIKKELKNMRIEVTHLPYRRKYRILNISHERADRMRFDITNNGQTRSVTVAQYFLEEYQLRLRFPNLPCLQVNPLNKNIYLPIEVCDMMEGQHCKKKLEDKQNAEMIKFTSIKPEGRFREIRDKMENADFRSDEYLSQFEISVDNRPITLDGRVIGPPSIRYNELKIVPHDGSWDMRDKQFFRGAEINNWVFLSFSSPRFCGNDQMENFARLLVNIGNKSGIRLRRPQTIQTIDTRRVSVKNVLIDMKKQFNADLAVIAVPATNKAIYGEVKQAAETILGLATQCVKDENVVKKCNPPLVSNLCQKINAKMGGINNSLTPGETPEILRRPVLIIGADVTHPSPSQDIKPSLAAAVGSLDAHPSRYAVTCRAQTNVDERKQAIEMILDLKGMVKELLIAFHRHTKGKKPEKIIFYRDGVSEGQFQKVKDHEIKCIREACSDLEKDYTPGITFIVVQKRHHLRFMPQDARDGVGRMKNIPPGTTVDNTVIHPLNFDFFLCSHFGLQGTSRPCHYTVLADDNDFSADDLHKLTYYLCHTYVRCTKSISCPAPVQYAHLAAFRARQHLVAQLDESSAASTDSGSSYHPLPDTVINAIKVTDGLKDTMYFV